MRLASCVILHILSPKDKVPSEKQNMATNEKFTSSKVTINYTKIDRRTLEKLFFDAEIEIQYKLIDEIP
jgi:hypothetical protein